MKTNSFLFLAAASSMVLAACSKDNGQIIDDGQIRLSTANVISETRSTDQSLQLTQFASNEKVDIFLVEADASGNVVTGTNVTSYAQPLKYTADGSGNLKVYDESNSNSEVPQYWPTSGNGLHIYGVYPSGSASAYTDTAKEFTVNTDQSSDDNYKASDLMVGAPESNPVARTTDAVKLTFKHLLTKVNINLTNGDGFSDSEFSSIKVSVLNTNPKATFSVKGQTAQASTTETTTKDIIAGDGLSTSSLKCSAIIVPQTVSGSTDFIKVEVGGGKYIYKLAAQTTFSASHVYTYNITVNKTGLTVTSNITDWTSVGDATSGTATLQ